MLIKQCKDTFIRQFGEIGYITSQLTKKDQVYDKAGAIFLSALSQTAKSLEDIIEELYKQFTGINRNQFQKDVYEFIINLESEGFLVTGENPYDLEIKDKGFTYSENNPKTIALRILTQDLNLSMRPSDDLMTEYFRDHPTIFGAHFEVTSRCNEQCIHCYQPRQIAREADLKMVIDVMDQLYEMGTVSMTLSGGEPFCHKDFAEILRQGRKHDLMLNILTNGTLLSQDNLEAIKEVNVNMIQVSLYSMNPDIHDSITLVPGSHSKTVQCIERFIENEIPVQVSFPIMKQNKDYYCDVSKWCSERKIRVLADFVLMARSDFDTSNLRHRLDLDETRQVIQDIIDVDGEYQIILDLEPKTKNIEHYSTMPVCGVAVDNICFTADGNIYPCSGFQGYTLGNVREKSVREIWETSERILFLRTLRNESFPVCLKCEARDYCIMCLVRNFNENNGDMFKVVDHFCKVAFINKELVDLFRDLKAGKN